MVKNWRTKLIKKLQNFLGTEWWRFIHRRPDNRTLNIIYILSRRVKPNLRWKDAGSTSIQCGRVLVIVTATWQGLQTLPSVGSAELYHQIIEGKSATTSTRHTSWNKDLEAGTGGEDEAEPPKSLQSCLTCPSLFRSSDPRHRNPIWHKESTGVMERKEGKICVQPMSGRIKSPESAWLWWYHWAAPLIGLLIVYLYNLSCLAGPRSCQPSCVCSVSHVMMPSPHYSRDEILRTTRATTYAAHPHNLLPHHFINASALFVHRHLRIQLNVVLWWKSHYNCIENHYKRQLETVIAGMRAESRAI